MNNIRTETVFGSSKTIVGNKQADLVLETLGKVYVKIGNNSRVLNDLFKLLDTSNSSLENTTIIVNSTIAMEEMKYPGDGYFIFNSLTNVLYLSYNDRYIALIDASNTTGSGYVKKTGDSMTGPLEINTVGAPLIIASSKLISNLNAQYLDGYSSDDLAKKKIDEYITGNWTFKGKGVSEDNWTFKDNIRAYGDFVTSGSISSPEFASGFGGYGWRFDADTNTLTIDNLVVRKAMRVYEMVINKITATNGSIWVSNSSKCSSAVQPIILTDTQLKSVGLWSGTSANKTAMLKLIKSGNYYLPTPFNLANTESIVTGSSILSNASSINTVEKTFVNYDFIIYISNPVKLVNNPLFNGASTLYDKALLTSTATDSNTLELKSCISLYYINRDPLTNNFLFNRSESFHMIPSNSTALADFESNGNASSYLTEIKPYYKYFALEQSLINTAITESDAQFSAGNIPSITVPNMWIVDTDDDEYPLFKAGDILRTQKYTDGNIKYYDALVNSQIGARKFIVQKAPSVFDIYTEISYNSDGSVNYTKEQYNTTQYDKTETSFDVNTGQITAKSSEAELAQSADPDSSSSNSSLRLDDIASDDDMIQIGNITDTNRQNAIYLTSSDNDGPFIDIITGLNRPDYSVLYNTPIYDRVKFINTTVDNGYRGVKYNYYIQTTVPTDTYVYPITKAGDSTQYYGTVKETNSSIIKTLNGKYRYSYTKTTKVRLGNLDGIYNNIFGNKQPYGNGLYGENVFLTGEFYLNNGQSVVDFSEDSILLKFNRAGLVLQDRLEGGNKVPLLDSYGNQVYDKDGNVVYETEMSFNADRFNFYIGNTLTMTLSQMFSDDKLNNTLLDINGWIKANGIEIWGPESTVDSMGNRTYISGTNQINAKIDTYGNLYAQDAYFSNAYLSGIIEADSGRIGSIFIKDVTNSVFEEAHSVLCQRLENRWGTSVYERAGFKLGIGKFPLFDNYPAVLEIFNYAGLSNNDNRYGIKVEGHMNAALWSSITSGIDPSTIIPNSTYMVAGFFDGNIYLGGSIGTRCHPSYQTDTKQYTGSTLPEGATVELPDGANPIAGAYYSGVTGRMTKIYRQSGHYDITVVNGLIVGWN